MSSAGKEYKESFGLGEKPDLEKTKNALEFALDIRKFEIGLYWQRAAYFWALIAGAFAGYFAILGSEHLAEKEYLAYIISCIGLVFSWAWFLVNRGSKFWQENWENHVDMLEDEITGPLYKTILQRPQNRPFVEKHIIGPQAVSVSTINLVVSIFTIAMWVALLVNSLPPFRFSWDVSWKRVVVGGITLLVMLYMKFCAGTYFGPHEHIATKRETKIIE